MFIKCTSGTVVQHFDDDGNLIAQDFYAGDRVQYVNTLTGKNINPPKNEKFFGFAMVQPDPPHPRHVYHFRPVVTTPSEANDTTYFVQKEYGGEENCIGIVTKNLLGWIFYNSAGTAQSGTFANRQDLFNYISGE